MGLFTKLFGAGRARDIISTPVALSSPWAVETSLGGVVISDALGVELSRLPMGRTQALSIPAVARGRGLIVSGIAPLPLVALRNGEPLPTQPLFLTRTDTNVSPAERMARTVDSLIFAGRALWAVKRGAKTEGSRFGPILDAVWVPDDEWSIDGDGFILVRGSRVDESEVIPFWGYTDGLLNTATRTLKGAIALEDAWVSKARNPIPLTVIEHVNSGSASSENLQLEDDEISELLGKWASARRSEDGALGYLPPGLTIATHGDIDPALYESGRNAIRVDIASHLGIPASLLDGSVAEASLTYVTTEGNAVRFWTETLPLYCGPIENALTLSMPGQTEIRFGRPELLTNPGDPIGAPESAPAEPAPAPEPPAVEEAAQP